MTPNSHSILYNILSTQQNILSKDTQILALKISMRMAEATAKAKAYNDYVVARIRYYAPHLTSSLTKSDKAIQSLLIKQVSDLLCLPRNG